MSFLLDTNVISELRKGDRADSSVTAWYSDQADEDIFLSVLTIGEIRRGAENIGRRDPASGSALMAWLDRIVDAHVNRIIGIDRKVAEEWGRLNSPDPVPVVDGLLAATAIVAGLTLVTRNTRDVERTGVDLLNPFNV